MFDAEVQTYKSFMIGVNLLSADFNISACMRIFMEVDEPSVRFRGGLKVILFLRRLQNKVFCFK